jgi:hypothetical protein
MTTNKKNIDLLFSETLKKFRERPPAYAWDRLEKDLNREKTSTFINYFRWIAASVLILLAFGAGYFYATLKTNNTEEFISGNQPSQMILPSGSNQEMIDDSSKKVVPKSNSQNVTNNQFTKSTLQPAIDQYVAFPGNYIIVGKTGIDENLIQKSDEEILITSNDIEKTEPHEDIALQEQNINNPITGEEKRPVLTDTDEPVQSNPLVLNDDLYIYEPEKSKNDFPKWTVGAMIAPVYSYRDISFNYENQTQANPVEAESEFDNSEEALISYGGGIDVNYHLSKRWSIQSGMYYSQVGQVNNNALNFVQDNDQYLLFSINTSTGNINVAFEKIPADIRKINPPKDTLESVDLNNVKIIQNFNLFEIPIMLKYEILSKKIGLSISGGLSPAYVLRNQTYLQVDNDKYNIGNSDNLKTMIYNSTIGLGINYFISKKLSLDLEPTFKYSLSPINKNSEFDYHPYSFSFFTGLSYKF